MQNAKLQNHRMKLLCFFPKLMINRSLSLYNASMMDSYYDVSLKLHKPKIIAICP